MAGLSEEDKRRIREEEEALYRARLAEEQAFREQVRNELVAGATAEAEDAYRQEVRAELSSQSPSQPAPPKTASPPISVTPVTEKKRSSGPAIAPPDANPVVQSVTKPNVAINTPVTESASAPWSKSGEKAAPKQITFPTPSNKGLTVAACVLLVAGIGLGVFGFLEFNKGGSVDDGPGESVGSMTATDSEPAEDIVADAPPDPPIDTLGTPMDYNLPDEPTTSGATSVSGEDGTTIIREPDGTVRIVPSSGGGKP